MMGEDGEFSLFDFPKIPRNLWTMPRLDKDVDAIAWAAHVAEFKEELLREANDNRRTSSFEK
jgi:hypothetical protein